MENDTNEKEEDGDACMVKEKSPMRAKRCRFKIERVESSKNQICRDRCARARIHNRFDFDYRTFSFSVSTGVAQWRTLLLRCSLQLKA